MAIRSGNYSHWITHNYCKPQFQQDTFQVEEFDSFHFVENDPIEEFYVNSTPSEDIWKKFELIPTPPLSPRRDEISTNAVAVLSPCSTVEKLRLVSEKLDDPISYTVVSEDYFAKDITDYFTAPTSPTGSTISTSSNGLISDCMWSAQFKSKTEATPKPKVTIRLEKADLSSYITETSHSDDCVDPTSVFPCPFPISEARCMRSRMEAQPDFSSESSESDEEIDVVTVPKFPAEKMRSILPITVASSKNPNSLLNPALLLNQQRPTVHILEKRHPGKVISLKRKSLSLPASPEPKEKRIKRENSVPELTKLVSPTKKSTTGKSYSRIPDYASYRIPSDDEDSLCGGMFVGEGKEKRAQHNVLERKRRYDLKYSFMVLRDVVPQLETQERAAKVVILQKAVECVEDLHQQNRELLRRKECEERRRDALEKKLEQLRSSFCY